MKSVTENLGQLHFLFTAVIVSNYKYLRQLWITDHEY